MQVVLCSGAITEEPEGPVCDGSWYLSESEDLSIAINNLASVLESLFVFDPWVFSTVLVAMVLAFVKGWGAGVIARLLSSQ